MDFYLEAVPVHLTAFMPFGKAGEGVSCLESEIFDEPCAHRREVIVEKVLKIKYFQKRILVIRVLYESN